MSTDHKPASQEMGTPDIEATEAVEENPADENGVETSLAGETTEQAPETETNPEPVNQPEEAPATAEESAAAEVDPAESATVPEAETVPETGTTPEAETVPEAGTTPEAETAPEAETVPETEKNTAPRTEERPPAVIDEEDYGVGPDVIVAPDLTDLPDDIADDFEAAIEATVLEFNEGDIVGGTVVSVDQDGALVDIGYKSEGLIPVAELSIRNSVSPENVVSVGDQVEALVLDKEDDEGRLILSKKRAQYERAWGRVQVVAREEGTVLGTVIEVVKGGLIVDIGLRGFLPASLVDLRRVRDLQPYIGEEIEAKVIELDRSRNNVVLSRRAHLEEEQAEQRQAFLDDLTEGEVREGVVSSVVNFGAFVDLGGMDGLVHVSELSWQHVNHPSEMVSVGDEVTIKVLTVEQDRERISLSIRQTQDDPWDVFSREHEIGEIVDGHVTKTVPFGAFVSVAEGVEGLVHVSEIAVHRVESPELELSIGQPVRVKITEKEDERRRISLSIKQALPDYKERQAAATQEQQQTRRRPPRREFEREFGPAEEERPPMPVDASLEAILQELKERGIGRR